MENRTVDVFLTELASGAPTPGGGGASAVCGAIAAALGSMVGNLTSGKKKYAENNKVSCNCRPQTCRANMHRHDGNRSYHTRLPRLLLEFDEANTTTFGTGLSFLLLDNFTFFGRVGVLEFSVFMLFRVFVIKILNNNNITKEKTCFQSY